MTQNEQRNPEAPTSVEETAAEYCARELQAIFDARRRGHSDYRRPCPCPCSDCKAVEACARLRAESFRRACESPAAIHCASTDRGDHHADTITIVYSDQYAKEALHAAVEIACGSKNPCPR